MDLNMKICQLFLKVMLCCSVLVTSTLVAQSGNQMLDGIGETGLIARYVFDGNVKDWSRNNLHAQLSNSKAEFINDDQFGKVLSLPGDFETFVSIPSEAIAQQESISITGWIYLRSSEKGQVFFDFGKNNTSHFFVAPRGSETNEGYQAVSYTHLRAHE